MKSRLPLKTFPLDNGRRGFSLALIAGKGLRFEMPGMPMPRVALYARYSSDLQNPRSVDDQFLICRQFAQQQGWQVAGCYRDEAVSGASLRGRDGICRLLADTRAGRFEFVCAETLHRISRDHEDMAHVYKLLRFAGVTLHTVSDGRADELQIGFRGTMNALYLKDLADKTR